MRLLTVGNPVLDVAPSGLRPGGTAVYATATVRALGLPAAWVGAIATHDLPLFGALAEGATVAPIASTVRFQNTYTPLGREQRVQGRPAPLLPEIVAAAFRPGDLVLVGPILGEAPPATVAVLPERHIAGICLQGYLRTVAAGGLVVPRDSNRGLPDLPCAHLATCFLSTEDLPCWPLERTVRDLLGRYARVVVTNGPHGATCYHARGSRFVPAFPTVERDPTGAGDVFAAAFCIRLAETGDDDEALAFAATAASFAVEGEGTSSLAGRDAIEARRASHVEVAVE